MNLYTTPVRGGNRGFTLIELLVVVAIIGVLSAITLAGFNSARQKSRDARRLEDIRQIRTALELYYATNRNYPAVLNAASLITAPNNFMPSIPVDPSTGAAYSYAAIGSGVNCTNYHLGATLENTGHSALNGDADTTGAAVCTGSATDFTGADSGTCSGSGTGACYDIKP
jgi:prepilin-type N-terminal cleavage/methylation domain-containing protein